jgi:hypothetical protein
MVNSDKALQTQPDILPQDLELIDYFIRGKRRLIKESNLRIEYGAKAVKLIDRQSRVVGVSKQVNEWQQKILLYRHSAYWTVVAEKISRSDFLAVTRTGHPDFAEYHKYQVPRGYQLFQQPAQLLLQSWQEQHQGSAGFQANGIMIYQGSNWYPVQEVDTYQEIIRLRTIISELTIGSADSMIWINRLPAAAHPPLPTGITNNFASGQVNSAATTAAFHSIPPRAMSIPNPPGTNTATGDTTKSELTAAFKTPVVTAITPAPSEVLTNLKNAIKLKALARLVDYLNDGEKIVNTEILKNSQGQVVSTKITEIDRGCPRWVIEQVKKF